MAQLTEAVIRYGLPLVFVIVLLEQMVERAGLDSSYTLEVRPSNATAIALYERFGFRSAGTRRRYYHDTGEDAVIMWRTAETASTPSASG